MPDLENKIALVTGASRGVGKGIALALAETGATLYLTGRTMQEGKAAVALPGSLPQTAHECQARGARVIPICCDHTDDTQTAAVFDRIGRDHGRLDLLVNNVWGGYEYFNDGSEFWLEKGFWTAPLSRFDRCFAAGVRAHYVCSHHAARLMVPRRSGLIATISFFASQKDDMGVAYGAAKAADDHLIRCMAHELRPHQVAAVGLYPGLVRTEAVGKARQWFEKQWANSESPQFVGRAVAQLAMDAQVLRHSGKMLVVAELAQQYGFTDIDGTRPQPVWPER